MRKQLYRRIFMAVLLAAATLFLAGCSSQNEAEEEPEAPIVRDHIAETQPVLSYAADDTSDWNKALSDNEISDKFAEAMSGFSFEMAGALLENTDDNRVFSPMSIYCALALAQSGAESSTKEEIEGLLGTGDIDDPEEQCKKLMLTLSFEQQRYRAKAQARGNSDYRSGLILADSLWFSKDLTVWTEYQERAAEDFFASSYAVNFENPDSDARIEYWIREMTDGVIYPRLNLPDDTLLAIVNTLYYYGAWEEPFDGEDTVEDIFTLEDGENVVMASYCCRTEPMGEATVGDGYMIASLQAENGAEMVILLPDEGHSVDEFLKDPDTLRSLMEGSINTACSLVWKIPKFSFGSSYSLPAALKKLGVEEMFTSEADFSGISDRDLCVSDILHEVHISLDEEGMEGGACTVIEMNEAIRLPQEETYEMICSHPFIFGIREQKTGGWLFLGVCRNPAQ